MTVCRFGPFVFDQNLLTLLKEGQRVSLRPKAALILAQLLRQPGEIVSKNELAQTVWHGRPIQDQTLFQTVSELRRALAPHTVVVTIPNVGYRCVLPQPTATRVSASVRFARRLSAAAAVLLLALVPSSLSLVTRSSTIHAGPAIQAFTLGMNHLDRPAEARRYFELAARENDGFLEAQLMLSETLLAQGQYDQATTIATALLSQASQQNLRYMQAGAMNVLSRLSEAAGQYPRAVDWARQAHRVAVEGGHACSAALANNRLLKLKTEPTFPSSPLAPEDKSRLFEWRAETPPVPLDDGSVATQNLIATCAELLPSALDQDDYSLRSRGMPIPPLGDVQGRQHA